MKHKHLIQITAICCSLAAMTQTSIGAEIITMSLPDAGFETPAAGEHNVIFNPTGSAWTFQGTCGVSGYGSGYNWFWAAPEGAQSAFLQDTGRISQTINLNSENTYVITFAAAQRTFGEHDQIQSQSWDLELDGVVIKSFDPGPVENYKDYTVTFTATTGSHELAFHGTNLRGGDNTINLDNVRIIYYNTANSGTGLKGEYFSTWWSLDGQPAFTRTDPGVNFVWDEQNQPGPSVQGTFAMRWTGKVQPLYSESYLFITETDDGVRLWVNGQLLIDEWREGVITSWGEIALEADQKYDIVMEYYNSGGGSKAQLFWESLSTPYQIIPATQLYPPVEQPMTGGLRGNYYSFGGFNNEPYVSRLDHQVNFLWTSTLRPDPSIPEGSFAVSWTGQIQPLHSETYTIYLYGNNFMSLRVNGEEVAVDWQEWSPREISADLPLTANQKYDIEVRYMTTSANGQVKLSWSSPSTPKEVIPSARLLPPAAVAGPFTLTPVGHSNGNFTLTLQGDTGVDYILQYSTNLTNWTSLSTNTAVSMPMTLIDTQATDTCRFYRVLVK